MTFYPVFPIVLIIVREEGLLTLWRGSAPTVARAMAMNLGMLTSYDEIKEQLNELKGTTDALETRVFASAIAGIICSFLSLPFDNVKVFILGIL